MIAGLSTADPRIALQVQGRIVNVSVITYGAPCDSAARTDVQLSDLTAVVSPYDRRGGCPDRSLATFEHNVTIEFRHSGAARVRVRALDASPRSAANPSGDTIVVERQLIVP